MTDSLSQIKTSLERIQALIPPDEDMKGYLRKTLDNQLASQAIDVPMGIVPTTLLSTRQMYVSARMSVELVENPEELATKPEGIIDLGIIEWILRPAFPLKNGRFEPVSSGPWQELKQTLVQETSLAVCRIDLLIEGYEPMHFGTGFIVGKNDAGQLVIMTNAHVIDEYTGAMRYGWNSMGGIELACDFERYHMNSGGNLFRLERDYILHPKYDLALLYLNQEQNHTPIPRLGPLNIASHPPSTIDNLNIGVIGHPAFDSKFDAFYKRFGFGDEYSIKRFSPGQLRALENRLWRDRYVDVFLHDASTLSGSSGSCVIDLNSLEVLGLHFGGWPKYNTQIIPYQPEDALARLFLANGAVPLWLLIHDPLLEDVNFV